MVIDNYVDFLSALFVSFAVLPGIMVGRSSLHTISTAIRDISIPLGIIGNIVGMILILSNMNDPSKLSAALSVAMLPILYGVLLAGLCQIIVAQTRQPPQPRSTSLLELIMATSATCTLLIPILGALFPNVTSVFDFSSLMITFIGIWVLTLCDQTVYQGESELSSLVRRVGFYSICTTGLGLLIMLVGLLANLLNPTAIGPMIAIGILTSLYSGLHFIGATLMYRAITKQTLPHLTTYTVGFLALYLFNMIISCACVVMNI